MTTVIIIILETRKSNTEVLMPPVEGAYFVRSADASRGYYFAVHQLRCRRLPLIATDRSRRRASRRDDGGGVSKIIKPRRSFNGRSAHRSHRSFLSAGGNYERGNIAVM